MLSTFFIHSNTCGSKERFGVTMFSITTAYVTVQNSHLYELLKAKISCYKETQVTKSWGFILVVFDKLTH